jgi:hypothetical protein
MKELQTYLRAFETLARHKTVSEACDLMESLGYDRDRMIVVGNPGYGNISKLAMDMNWTNEKIGKILVKFKGGPGASVCGRSIFTATLCCFVVDRIIQAINKCGLDFVLDEISDCWGVSIR